MPIATVSSKGQLVIPKKVRDALNIKAKQKVLLKLVGGRAELTPVPEDPVEAFCGVFAEGVSLVDALLEERKEEARREEKDAARLLRPSVVSKKRR
jgi:AbrB family looped-hinge helix DNA binding protein